MTIGKSADETATLTIEAGTEVRLRSRVTLNVGASAHLGALKAQGTQSNPIVFTSDASEPSPGDWQTITFNGQADDGNSVLEHCVVEYGGSQVGNIYIINNALPTITNCTIRNSKTNGIYISSLNDPLTIRNNIFSGNETGMHNADSSNIVDARYNNWGHPTGPYDPSDDTEQGGFYNPEGRGDPVSDYINYDPWSFGIAEGSQLTPGVTYERTINSYQTEYFSFESEPGKALLIEVVPQSGIHSVYFGSEFDQYTSDSLTARGSYELLISPTEAETYEFYLNGSDVDTAGGSYTITARYVDQQYLSDVYSRSASNEGTATLTLTGLSFSEDTRVILSSAGLPEITTEDVVIFSPTEIYATFDLNGVQPGVYDVEIRKEGESSSVLEAAFEVTSGGIPGHLRVVVNTPQFVRPSRKYTCWIEYENDGGTDLSAPLFVVSNNANASMRLSKDEPFREGSVQILGINNDGPAGTLPPGAANRIPVYFKVPTGLGSSAIEFSVERMTADSTPIDWSSFENDIRPDDMEDDVWNVVFSNLKTQLGSTWATYHLALTRDATYLSTYSRSVEGILVGDELTVEDSDDISLYDVRTLLQFEFSKASAEFNPRSTLASGTDVYVPAPGIPLVFGRVAYQSVPDRFRVGPFGRGWYHIYEYKAEKEDNEDVTIKGPGNSARLFQATGTGAYQGLPGDFGNLTAEGNGYVLREKTGTIWRFGDAGELSSVEDLNGNTLTFSYSGDSLTEIAHSDGENITISYNGSGQIIQVTAPGNRVVTYRYDGEYLAEIEEPGNVVTGYAYNPSDGTPSSHAMTTITLPDLTHYHYSYDEKGRLAAEQPDGDAGRITYAYDDVGTVTVTDNSEQSTSIRFGIGGEVLEIRYPDGARVTNASDNNSLMSQITGPKGKSVSIAYDTNGNPVGMKNPLNQLVRMSFDPDNSRLTRLEDARSNVIEFTYDDAGNPESIVYPDETVETYDYDASGNIDG